MSIFGSLSGVLENEHTQELTQISLELQQLSEVFQALVKCKGEMFESGLTELQTRLAVTQYLHQVR